MNTVRVINYMKWRKLAAVISIFLVVGSLASLATKGLVLGLDFTGGTQIEVGFERDADLGVIHRQLSEAGFENPVVVHFGSNRDALIKFQAEPDKDTAERIVTALSAAGEKVELRRIEFVGPQVGEELRDDGGLGLIVAFGLIMLYVSIRFQYKFAIGAVLGQVFDLIIVVIWGTFSSIYIAVTALLWLKVSREDVMQKVKVEGVDEYDGLP